MRLTIHLLAVVLALAASGSEAASDGFEVNTKLPDGHYDVKIQHDGSHQVRRWAPVEKRWQRLQKREGSGEYTFLVNEDKNEVESVSLDLFAKQHLPIPKSKTLCMHYHDYNTLSYPLIADDYYASKQAFYHSCDNFEFQSGQISMALNGNVAVYVCQRPIIHPNYNRCSKAEFEAAEKVINETCGLAAGYSYIRRWNKEYGRTWRGEKICRDWGKFRTHHPGVVPFRNGKGRGRVLHEPLRNRPKKSKEQFYNETVFEPLRGGGKS